MTSESPRSSIGALDAPIAGMSTNEKEDRERIEQLKAEVRRLAGDQGAMWGIDQLPPDVAEQFRERVIAFEKYEAADADARDDSQRKE